MKEKRYKCVTCGSVPDKLRWLPFGKSDMENSYCKEHWHKALEDSIEVGDAYVGYFRDVKTLSERLHHAKTAFVDALTCIQIHTANLQDLFGLGIEEIMSDGVSHYSNVWQEYDSSWKRSMRFFRYACESYAVYVREIDEHIRNLGYGDKEKGKKGNADLLQRYYNAVNEHEMRDFREWVNKDILHLDHRRVNWYPFYHEQTRTVGGMILPSSDASPPPILGVVERVSKDHKKHFKLLQDIEKFLNSEIEQMQRDGGVIFKYANEDKT